MTLMIRRHQKKDDQHENRASKFHRNKSTIAAFAAVEKLNEKCHTIDHAMFDRLPQFNARQIELGKVLGHGGFNTVYEITSIDLDHPTVPGESTQEHGNTVDNNRRYHQPKYVMKALRHGFIFDHSYRMKKGSADLAIEAHILASIDHPNIIKLHGISNGGILAFEKLDDCKKIGFFLVLDRLSDTLGTRLKTWARVKRQLNGHDNRYNIFVADAMAANRLRVVRDVASAVAYLHEKDIIFRDLKCDNIGFDMTTGDVKLFDFGLARELSSYEKIVIDGHDGDETTTTTRCDYKMSMTGSRYYMAPEVIKLQPYNTSADVYSFGILLWEICALKMAFSDYNHEMHHRLVVMMGGRPEVDDSWPLPLKMMMIRCWSEDRGDRPCFRDIVKTLEICLDKSTRLTI